MIRSKRDPFGRMMPPAKPEPEISNLMDLLNLSESVGATAPNHRRDVAKVESLMDQAGYLDLQQTDGPTGFYGECLKQAVKNFQKDNGLKKDGTVNPNGETVKAIAQTAAEIPVNKRAGGHKREEEQPVYPGMPNARPENELDARLRDLGVSHPGGLAQLDDQVKRDLIELAKSGIEPNALEQFFSMVSGWIEKEHKEPYVISQPTGGGRRS